MENTHLTQRITLVIAAILAVGLIGTATFVTLTYSTTPGSMAQATDLNQETVQLAASTQLAAESGLQLRGTVTTIAAESVTIEPANGETAAFTASIAPETVVAALDTASPPLPGKKQKTEVTPIDWTAIQPGDTIVISTSNGSEQAGQAGVATQVLLLL